MPELPEVETVRRGLAELIVDTQITRAQILHPRTARHHCAGPEDLAAQLPGNRITAVGRRGKFMWLELNAPADATTKALLVHLGMSGQMLCEGPAPQAPVNPPNPALPLAQQRYNPHHVRAELELMSPSGPKVVRFVDQRTFGYWRLSPLAAGIPQAVSHIAPDLLDPALDMAACAAVLGTKKGALKRLLLEQSIISGIGNIYADEMLWAARLHPARPAHTVPTAELVQLLESGQEIMRAAIAAGGTSFDALYVNVNGESGYFSTHLNAYGQGGKPCGRCGTPMEKTTIAQRGTSFCPNCQVLIPLG